MSCSIKSSAGEKATATQRSRSTHQDHEGFLCDLREYFVNFVWLLPARKQSKVHAPFATDLQLSRGSGPSGIASALMALHSLLFCREPAPLAVLQRLLEEMSIQMERCQSGV